MHVRSFIEPVGFVGSQVSPCIHCPEKLSQNFQRNETRAAGEESMPTTEQVAAIAEADCHCCQFAELTAPYLHLRYCPANSDQVTTQILDRLQRFKAIRLTPHCSMNASGARITVRPSTNVSKNNSTSMSTLASILACDRCSASWSVLLDNVE